MNELQHFFEIKKSLDDKKIKDRSLLTLEYYEKVGKMLDSSMYEYCSEFLQSVMTYIETKEIITDKQIEAVENIVNSTMYEDTGERKYY